MREEEALHKIRTTVHSPGPIRSVYLQGAMLYLWSFSIL